MLANTCNPWIGFKQYAFDYISTKRLLILQESQQCYTPEMLKILAIVGELTNKVFPKPDSRVVLTDEELDDVAEVAYTTSATFKTQHDGVPRKAWGLLLEVEKRIMKIGVKRILDNPHAQPAQLHEQWCERKRGHGWTYGHTKNNFERKHPELLPYKFLPAHKQRGDLLIYVIVHTMVGSLRDVDEHKT